MIISVDAAFGKIHHLFMIKVFSRLGIEGKTQISTKILPLASYLMVKN